MYIPITILNNWLNLRCYFEINYNLACKNGTFGYKCSLRCGNCRGKEHCHHINGTCMNGCDNGYQGLQCNEGWDIKSRT